MADRHRPMVARGAGLAIAAAAGAVIACSAAAPASATEGDTDRGAQASTSESSRPPSSGAATRRAHDRPGPRAAATTATDDDRIDEVEEVEEVDEPDPAPSEEDVPEDEKNASTSTARTSSVTFVENEPAAADDDATPPDTPAVSPAAWTLLGSAARRHAREATAAPPPDTTSQPVDAEPESVSGPDTAATPLTDPSDDAESLYTGRPSFVHNVVTVGLYVLKAVLRPFGGLLAFTSLKVPFLTDGVPPFFLTPGLDVERSEFEGMKVWTLTPRKDPTDKAVIALHGGAYMATASIFHWWTYADMARNTGATVIVPLQTLVPAGGTAASEVPRTADFITAVIDQRGAENVSVFGDSAGGGLALAAMQELARRGSRNPARLVLLAPWLDVSMRDPRSAKIRDPLLDLPNLTRSGAKWAGAAGPEDPQASPLFGSSQGLPPTYVYSSSLDLLTVDTLRLRDRVLAEHIPDVTFRLRNGLIHDWFTFPFLPDAHEDRAGVYEDLLGTDSRADVG